MFINHLSSDPCVESEREGGNFDQVWTGREIWGACRFAIFLLIFIEYELMTSFRWCWFGWWHCQCLVRWLARCLDCWMSTWLAMMTEFFPANGAKKLSWRIWAFCCFKCYKWCIIKRILEGQRACLSTCGCVDDDKNCLFVIENLCLIVLLQYKWLF